MLYNVYTFQRGGSSYAMQQITLCTTTAAAEAAAIRSALLLQTLFHAAGLSGTGHKEHKS
jgi:hypothetical protein